MKKLKDMLIIWTALLAPAWGAAQDPSFSQFFASPLNINPALTGNFNGKWRAISNLRDQWVGPGNPYRTGTLSVDNKVFQNVVGNYVDEVTRLAVGGMFMYDEALDGALKGNYASFNVSGNVRLYRKEGYEQNGMRIRHLSKIKTDESAERRLGLGLGVSYGHRRVDPTKLTFEEQFTGNGFDTNLPTGESAFTNTKPFLSVNAGITFSAHSENANFDMGASVFHFNKPRQTFLSDENQSLPRRFVVHANYERFLTEVLTLNTNGIYQYQSGASYFSVGGLLGYYLPSYETEMIVNAGLWYWSSNAVIPYVGFSYGNMQLGLSYDITISGLRNAPRRPHTFELCLIYRGKETKDNGVIPSPWK